MPNIEILQTLTRIKTQVKIGKSPPLRTNESHVLACDELMTRLRLKLRISEIIIIIIIILVGRINV